VCDLYELESCTVWSEEKRRARKTHVCSSCRGVIRPGEDYWTHFSVADGRAVSEKICGVCFVAREDFAEVHAVIPTPGYFAQSLVDCYGSEAREFWTDEDRRWRKIYAGMLRRGRAAKRERIERVRPHMPPPKPEARA
jgi:hypothetical protein